MFKLISESVRDSLGTVILFTGRGGIPHRMLESYVKNSGLNRHNFKVISPEKEWYPPPKGAKDQRMAVLGLEETIPELDKFITEIGVNKSKTVLAGFSAGAVVALHLGNYTEEPFKAVICHNGACIGEPGKAKHKTPFLLIHSQDDNCFGWKERYVPMKKYLTKNGYEVNFVEKEKGGHAISEHDYSLAAIMIAGLFEYPLDWKPPFETA